MRIRIITCHDVYNAGASLQAYALMQYLKDCGHEVKIIDYKPDYLSRHYSLKAVNNPEYDRGGIKNAFFFRLFLSETTRKRQKGNQTHEKQITRKSAGQLGE